jgi:peptidoglycan/xylan/chitin deacetylase (PgdA/CDA1 family)
MYHDVIPGRSPGAASRAYFSVERQTFAAQLDQLAAEGYTVRSLESALSNPCARQVAVSFDDGDLGQFEQGFPELARRGMTATFFITTDWVGRPGYVSWDALRQMRAGGMSIQSHTCSHPFLSELPPERVQHELRSSREILNQQLGQETEMLGLPGGDFPRGGPQVFEDAGYRVVATSRWGINAPTTRDAGRITFVRRCTVRRAPSPGEFRATISGDAWLSARRRLRGFALSLIRRTLTPTRYQRWRRAILDAR